jgi:hypothetical protein
MEISSVVMVKPAILTHSPSPHLPQHKLFRILKSSPTQRHQHKLHTTRLPKTLECIYKSRPRRQISSSTPQSQFLTDSSIILIISKPCLPPTLLPHHPPPPPRALRPRPRPSSASFAPGAIGVRGPARLPRRDVSALRAPSVPPVRRLDKDDEHRLRFGRGSRERLQCALGWVL